MVAIVIVRCARPGHGGEVIFRVENAICAAGIFFADIFYSEMFCMFTQQCMLDDRLRYLKRIMTTTEDIHQSP